VAVLVGGGAHTIADVADAAFTTHALSWVAALPAALWCRPAYHTHFTRKSNSGSVVVTTEKTLAGVTSPVIWALLFGMAMVVTTGNLVSRMTLRIERQVEGYSLIS
jgi:hypothetical protein